MMPGGDRPSRAAERPRRNSIVVCGTTASGKTALGARLAAERGGEIISADSRQVYRGMDIGTGKDLGEYRTPQGQVPYHLIDVADPREVYSLFRYQRDFYRAFEDVASRGRLPVVVGGTGLYIEAAIRRFRVPDVPADPEFRRASMRRDLPDLVGELAGRSPELWRRTVLDCKRRVVRALEIARHEERSGKAPVNETALDIRPVVLLVTWPREELAERIRARLLRRLEEGLLDEVRRLLAAGISGERYDLYGMEYRHAARFLRGEVTYETMVEDLLADIRYLARRQRTYFRGMVKRGVEAHEVPRAGEDRAREILEAFRIEPWL